MTSEAAVVHGLFARAAAGDFAGVSRLLDPDVVWFGTRGGLDEHRVMRGPQACVAYMREIAELWERFDVEVERLVETGDTVLALLRESARTRDLGLELENRTATIFRVRRGMIVEMRGYLDRDEALRAAGLAGEPRDG